MCYRVPGNRAHVEALFARLAEEPNTDLHSLDIPVNAVATGKHISNLKLIMYLKREFNNIYLKLLIFFSSEGFSSEKVASTFSN